MIKRKLKSCPFKLKNKKYQVSWSWSTRGRTFLYEHVIPAYAFLSAGAAFSSSLSFINPSTFVLLSLTNWDTFCHCKSPCLSQIKMLLWVLSQIGMLFVIVNPLASHKSERVLFIILNPIISDNSRCLSLSPLKWGYIEIQGHNTWFLVF